MQVFGIDISVWQKGINLSDAKKDGANFAIIRGAFTGSASGKPLAKDSQFETHYKNALENGLGIGCYYFSRACSYDEGVKEANYLYNNCLKGKKFDYPIYMDVEDTVYQIKAGKNNVSNAIKGFCETLENLGYYVGVYANLNWIKNYINYNDLKDKYDFWIALWNKTKPSNTYKYGMWQFGGETNKIRSNQIAGMTVDQNYAFKDYPAIMKKVGLNGFEKEIIEEIIEKPIIEEPVDVVEEIIEKPVEKPVEIIKDPIIEEPIEVIEQIIIIENKKNFWHYLLELISTIIKNIRGVK